MLLKVVTTHEHEERIICYQVNRKRIDVKDLHENEIILYLACDIDSIQSDRALPRGNHLKWIFVE